MVEAGHKGNDTSTQGTRSAHSHIVFIWLNPTIATLTGPSDFVGEYVTTRNIPIPKLLQALGVELVCEPLKLWLYSHFLKGKKIIAVSRVGKQKTKNDAVFPSCCHESCVSYSFVPSTEMIRTGV